MAKMRSLAALLPYGHAKIMIAPGGGTTPISPHSLSPVVVSYVFRNMQAVDDGQGQRITRSYVIEELPSKVS